MSPTERSRFQSSSPVTFLRFCFADGITGKSPHIYHIMFSSIDWIEDLSTSHRSSGHGVFLSRHCLGLIFHFPSWDFICSESIDLIPPSSQIIGFFHISHGKQ